MIKFVNHSVIIHPISNVSNAAFNRMGSEQVVMHNARMAARADKPNETPSPAIDMVRKIIYRQVEEFIKSGLYNLQANPGVEGRFEGTVILPSVGVRNPNDSMPMLDLGFLGHFTVDTMIPTDTLHLIKRIAEYQLKSPTNITTKDGNTAFSDDEVHFELARARKDGAFMLRIFRN